MTPQQNLVKIWDLNLRKLYYKPRSMLKELTRNIQIPFITGINISGHNQLQYILIPNIYTDYKYVIKSDVFLILKDVKYHNAKGVTNVKRNYSSRL